MSIVSMRITFKEMKIKTTIARDKTPIPNISELEQREACSWAYEGKIHNDVCQFHMFHANRG